MTYQRSIDEARRLADALPPRNEPGKPVQFLQRRAYDFCQQNLRELLDLIDAQDRAFNELHEKHVKQDVAISRLATQLHVAEMDVKLTRNELAGTQKQLELVTASHRQG